MHIQVIKRNSIVLFLNELHLGIEKSIVVVTECIFHKDINKHLYGVKLLKEFFCNRYISSKYKNISKENLFLLPFELSDYVNDEKKTVNMDDIITKIDPIIKEHVELFI